MAFGKISVAVVTSFEAPTIAAAFQAVDATCLYSTVNFMAEAAGIIGGIIIPGTT